MQSSNEKVNEFLVDIQSTFPKKFEIVEEIRKVFFSVNPEIDEEIKYGGVAFNVSGQLVGGIYVYKQHISIEVSHGAQFIDSDEFLEAVYVFPLSENSAVDAMVMEIGERRILGSIKEKKQAELSACQLINPYFLKIPL